MKTYDGRNGNGYQPLPSDAPKIPPGQRSFVGEDLKRLVQDWMKENNFCSYREASDATGLDHAYLYRLAKGESANPSSKVLRKLGLRREVIIRYSKVRS